MVKRSDFSAHLAMTGRSRPVTKADRTSLGIIRRHQAWTSEAMQDCGELPAEVASIADAGVHAITAGWNVLMSSVACQQDPIGPIGLRHEQVRSPGVGNQDFVFKVAACKFPQQPVQVHRLRCNTCRPSRLKGPCVAIVLRDQRADSRLIMPSHSPTLQHVGRPGAEVRHEALHHARLTFKANAKTVAHLALTSVATDQVSRAHLFGPPVRGAERRGHPVCIFDSSSKATPQCASTRGSAWML